MFLPIKEYVITLAGVSERTEILPPVGEVEGNLYRVRIFVPGSDVVCRFGDSTVVADTTVTAKARADGNFTVFGAIGPEEFEYKQNQRHLAITGTGTVYVTLGYAGLGKYS
jgi:hypothetical protein